MTKSYKPLVSVIIPAYNSALYITEALKSVAEQTYSNIEVFVVDDHSSDETEKVAADSFNKFGLKGQVLRRPGDHAKGAGGCRNVGIAISNGEIIAFLDSDDAWLPHHISNAVRRFKYYREDIVAYCCRAKVSNPLRESGEILLPHDGFPVTGKVDITSYIINRMFVPNQTLCVWRSFLEQTMAYHEELNCYEDWWLVLHLAKLGNFFCSDDIGCLVRVRDESLSNWTNEKGRRYMSQAMFSDAIQICLFAENSPSLTSLDIKNMRKSIISFIKAQLRDNLRARYWKDANLVVRGMLSTNPVDCKMVLAIWAGTLKDLSCLLLTKISKISCKT